LVNPSSFENVRAKWFPEVSHHCPNTPIVLLGTKSDLREDTGTLERLKAKKQSPISKEQIETMENDIRAIGYFEISSYNGDGISTVPKELIRLLLLNEDNMARNTNKKSRCSIQ